MQSIHPKVTAATLGSAVVTIVIVGFSLAGVHLSPAAEGTLTSLAALVAGFLVSA